MRVRMIRPSYWSDADLHTRLTADVREFYVGLWMMSDDHGYIAWDLDRVGAELYPYRSLGWRRSHLPRWVELLAPHVAILECGVHLRVPSLEKYQSPPKPSYQNEKAHRDCLLRAPHGTNGRHMAPAQEGKGVIEGRGREEGEGGAAAPTEFQERMAAVGSTIGIVKHRADH